MKKDPADDRMGTHVVPSERQTSFSQLVGGEPMGKKVTNEATARFGLFRFLKIKRHLHYVGCFGA